MNNQSVINAFALGKKGRSSNGNLYTDGTRLMNYSTCLAQRLSSGTILFNATKYSVSTSKIQTWTLGTLMRQGVNYRPLYSVPMGAYSLERYIK